MESSIRTISRYRCLSATILIFIVACTPDKDISDNSKYATEQIEFQELTFEAYKHRCKGDNKCLYDIEKLRECYLEKGVYYSEVDLTDQKAIVQLFDIREQCQRDLGFYEGFGS